MDLTSCISVSCSATETFEKFFFFSVFSVAKTIFARGRLNLSGLASHYSREIKRRASTFSALKSYKTAKAQQAYFSARLCFESPFVERLEGISEPF